MSGLSRLVSCCAPKVDDVVKDTIVSMVKETFTPTGNYEADKACGEAYAKSAGMDEANTKMAVIMATKGQKEAAKAMMKDCGGDYFAMRAKYG
jgi:hypothetical protein